MSQIEQLETEILAAIGKVDDLAALEQIRVSALGKKGSISALMRALANCHQKSARALANR